MNEFRKTESMKNRSELENWYNCLVKTNNNELIKYLVFSYASRHASKIKRIKRFDKLLKLEENPTFRKEVDSIQYIRNLFKLGK